MANQTSLVALIGLLGTLGSSCVRVVGRGPGEEPDGWVLVAAEPVRVGAGVDGLLTGAVAVDEAV